MFVVGGRSSFPDKIPVRRVVAGRGVCAGLPPPPEIRGIAFERVGMREPQRVLRFWIVWRRIRLREWISPGFLGRRDQRGRRRGIGLQGFC